METIPKCLLLPIDGTSESLRPIKFIGRLYPVSEVSLILCYFPALSREVHSGIVGGPVEAPGKKREILGDPHQDARRIFAEAKKVLLKAGFSEELIQEQIQQREMSVAKQACILANIRKVDAVLVQKLVTSSLEGFLKGDPTSTLLHHCLRSPVWFTEGEIDPKNAAICVVDEDASLRIADHAGFMLSGSGANITLLQAVRRLPAPISWRSSDILKRPGSWEAGVPVSSGKLAYLLRAVEILKDYGIDEGRIQITLIPDRGDTAGEILSWCANNGVGIIGLGHSAPEGVWSFLKTSVTQKILSDFKNMAVWVAQ